LKNTTVLKDWFDGIKKNPFKDWLVQQNPHLSDQELDIWISGMDKKSAKDMLEQFNVKNKDIIASANDL
jgi:hypothetical protein